MKKKVLNRGFNTIKTSLNKLSKKSLKGIKIILTGAICGICTTLERFYDRFSVIVSNTSKVAKMSLFYAIIGISIISISNYYSKLQFNSIHKEITQEPKVEEVAYVEEVCDTSKYTDTTCMIQEASRKYDVNWKLAVAIAKAETGKDYSSNAARVLNNFGGNMLNGKLASFETKQAGIDYLVYNLKVTYLDKGLTTPEAIQKIYAPIGATNDKNNLNSNWLKNVNYYMSELDGE